MLQIVEKARRPTEVQRLARLLRRQEKRIRDAFNSFVRVMKSDMVIRQVRQLIEANRIEDALNFANSHIIRIADVQAHIFRDVGADELDQLERKLRNVLGATATAGIGVSFDVTNSRAVALMRRNRLDFIREFSRGQMQVTRDALVSSMRRGIGPAATARSFRDSIGLTLHQNQAVENYRTALETGNRDALQRALRDRRFDPTVAAAADGTKTLSRLQIARMTDRYRQRMLSMRAETISRTEAHKVLNQARDEAFKQTIVAAGLEQNQVKRIWRATLDERTRFSHAAMEGQERRMDEPFLSPFGAALMFPGDTSAPPEETINCRCVLEITIAEPD